MFSYRYFELGSAQPLTRCPQCHHALTEKGGICLALSVGGQAVAVSSRLNENGRLEDTEDSAVAHGHHAGSYCGGCGELLLDVAAEEQREG